MAAPKDTPAKPAKKAKVKVTSVKAQERLAEALRENLRRRKAQERARDETAKDKPR
jgi:hypothetical protein